MRGGEYTVVGITCICLIITFSFIRSSAQGSGGEEGGRQMHYQLYFEF